MKKISTILFATTLGLFSLASCSNDDNAPVVDNTNHLLGKWTLNTMSLKSTENGEVVQEFEDMPVQEVMTWEYTFKEDNTFEYLMAVPQAQLEEKGVGTYSKNGNSITITVDGDPATFEIKALDAKNLHLKNTEEYEADGIKFVDVTEQKFIK